MMMKSHYRYQLSILSARHIGSSFFAVSVVIAEIVAIVVLLLNVQAHRLCRDIQVSFEVRTQLNDGDITGISELQQVIFSFIVAFFYLATGIACALYANAWAATPEECKTDEDFDCTEEAFTATNALQAVSDTHNQHKLVSNVQL